MERVNCFKKQYQQRTGKLNQRIKICQGVLGFLPKVEKSLSKRALPSKRQEDEVSDAGSTYSVLTAITERIAANYKLKDFQLLKSMSSPPTLVAKVMNAVLILISDSQPLPKPSWANCLKLMANPKALIQKVCNFNVDSVTPLKFKKLKEVTDDFNFSVESIKKVSSALSGLGEWILCIRDYLVDRGLGSKVKGEPEIAMEEEKSQEKSEEQISEYDQQRMLELITEAKANVESLKPADLTELKAFKNPPEASKLVMEGMCHMFKLKPVRTFNQLALKYEYDYWLPAKKLLGSMDLLKNMLEYDKDNVSSSIIEKVKKILQNPKCTPQKVQNCSKALYGIRMWMEAIIAYSTLKSKFTVKRQGEEDYQKEAKKEQELDYPIEETKLQVEKEIVTLLEPENVMKVSQNKDTLRDILKKWVSLITEEKEKAREFALKCTLSSGGKDQPNQLKKRLIEAALTVEQGNLVPRREILQAQKADAETKQEELMKGMLELLRRGTSPIELLMVKSFSDKLVQLDEALQQIQEQEQVVEQFIQKITDDFAMLIDYASALYLCVRDLRRVNQFYAFSAQEFLKLFRRVIEQTQQIEVLETRKLKLKQDLLFRVHQWVSPALFEEDRFLFSFLLIHKLETNSLHPNEFKFLVQPYGSHSVPNPTNWLSDKTWQELCWLSELSSFSGLNEGVAQNSKEWMKLLDRDEPHQYKLPGVWRQRLNEFHFLLVLRVLRPEKLPLAIESLVSNLLGQQFSSTQNNQFLEVIKRSGARVPIILNSKSVAGAECAIKNTAVALSKKFRIVYSASTYKEDVIKAAQDGTWIYLANQQQISKGWDQDLKKVHPGFRLFLSASHQFSQHTILTSSKYALENPTTFKEILLNSLKSCNLECQFEKVPHDLRKAMATIVLLHSTLSTMQSPQLDKLSSMQQFNEHDLQYAVNILSQWHQRGGHISSLRYMLRQIVYGGKVIEQNEQIAIKETVAHFFPDNFLSEKTIVEQISPPLGSFEQFKEFCEKWTEQECDPLGVISGTQKAVLNQRKVDKLLTNSALILNPQCQSKVQIIEAILADLPSPSLLKTSYSSYQGAQVNREIEAYNRKIIRMRDEILRLKLQIESGQHISHQDKVKLDSLVKGEIPKEWRTRGLNADNLTEAIETMKSGLYYFQNWSRNGVPPIISLHYFINPEAFLRATALEFASSKGVKIEDVQITFHPIDSQLSQELNINGEVSINGAGWNPNLQQLEVNGFITKLSLGVTISEQEEMKTRCFECPMNLGAVRGSKPEILGQVQVRVRKEDEEELRRRGASFSLNKKI